MRAPSSFPLDRRLRSTPNTHTHTLTTQGYNDLGEFCYQRGDLEQALKNFVRTRDYCSVTRHNVEMCLNVVKVSVALGSFGHVSNYVAKAEHTPDLNDARAQSKMRAAAGLALLHQGAYAAAARKFLECDPEQLLTPPATTASTAVPTSSSASAAAPAVAAGAGAGSDAPPSAFAEVVAPEDVAIYGGLCALATFGRGELKRRVVESLGFKVCLYMCVRVFVCCLYVCVCMSFGWMVCVTAWWRGCTRECTHPLTYAPHHLPPLTTADHIQLSHTKHYHHHTTVI